HNRGELRAHLFDRARGIDDAKTLRLRARAIEIGIAHALEEGRILALELVGAATAGLRTRETFARDLRRHVEQDRAIRLAIGVNPGLEHGDALQRHAMAAALVGERRIGVAIAQHPIAARERRTYHLLDVLASRRE